MGVSCKIEKTNECSTSMDQKYIGVNLVNTLANCIDHRRHCYWILLTLFFESIRNFGSLYKSGHPNSKIKFAGAQK